MQVFWRLNHEIVVGLVVFMIFPILGGGPFVVNRGPHYHVLQKYLELEAEKMSFANHVEYKAALKGKPKTMLFATRRMTERPEPYHDIFPEWPEDGLQIFYTRLPSSNASSRSRYGCWNWVT